MDAFDADVLIYAVTPGHASGERVRALFGEDAGAPVGVGSVLLIPEVLSKPRRTGDEVQLRALSELLQRLDLLAVDRALSEVAAVVGAKHGLRTVDAIHLATALEAGADRFITNNKSDFPQSITEIDVTYPSDLPDGG